MERTLGALEAQEEHAPSQVRAPLELVVTHDADELGGGESGTTRRAMVTRGLVLIAGAFGAGVAATKLTDGDAKTAVPPATGRTTFSLTTPTVRWQGTSKPGSLPDGGNARVPHGTLLDAGGREVGEFTGAAMVGAGAPTVLRFEFTDGTVVGLGSGFGDTVYAVIGGTGRYDDAGGSLQVETDGKSAEITFRLTNIER